MNYSTALLESIEAAQILAGHYQGAYLRYLASPDGYGQ